MRIRFTRRAQRDHRNLTNPLRKALAKQLRFLLEDARHPSLDIKKYDIARGVYQGRVNRGHRFYFVVEGDTYVILSIVPHPK